LLFHFTIASAGLSGVGGRICLEQSFGRFVECLQQLKGMTVNISFNTVCLAAAVLAGSTALASAQSGSTDSCGNAMGSERIGNGVPTRDGARHQGMQGTTGMSNNKRSEQDNPNGSPNTPPISREGPGGDPSRNNDAPK
jgi:hypothetical protein